MAKRDIDKYYTKIEKSYFDMLAEVKDIDDAYQKGQLSYEKVEQAKAYIETLKGNYERWSYMMLLWNMPNRKEKKEKYKKANKELFDYLKDSSVDKTLLENQDVLKNLRKLVKGKKK